MKSHEQARAVVGHALETGSANALILLAARSHYSVQDMARLVLDNILQHKPMIIFAEISQLGGREIHIRFKNDSRITIRSIAGESEVRGYEPSFVAIDAYCDDFIARQIRAQMGRHPDGETDLRFF